MRFFALLLAVLSAAPLFSQSAVADSLVFPGSWAGVWKGQLEIYNERGLAQSVPMQLRILPTDTAGQYTWHLIYGPDEKAGLRPYLLRAVDAAKGRYIIDEQNSIAMECYLLGGKFYSCFEVMGTLLFSITEKQGDRLVSEIVSGRMQPVSTTGGKTVEGEEVPPVKTYPLMARQTAVLKRG